MQAVRVVLFIALLWWLGVEGCFTVGRCPGFGLGDVCIWGQDKLEKCEFITRTYAACPQYVIVGISMLSLEFAKVELF